MHTGSGVPQHIVDTEQFSLLKVVDTLHLNRVSLNLILGMRGREGGREGGNKGWSKRARGE